MYPGAVIDASVFIDDRIKHAIHDVGVASTDIHSIVYKSHCATQNSTEGADSETVLMEETAEDQNKDQDENESED